jgi:metal-sulfur cluster biosynthetic enzyme
MNSRSALPTIDSIRAILGQVYDPEFGISVADLGLIHDVTVDASGAVKIVMTLTSRYCPAGEVILTGVRTAAESVAGVSTVEVVLVWEPMWTPDRLSAEARRQLGWDDPPIDT